jgi:O-antigen/teichoic acid export membrane protein
MRFNHALLGGSFILVVTFGIFNVLNYLYHLGMLRMLSVAEYGILATLLAIVYIIGIFTESIQTVLAKYTAAESSPGRIKNLLNRSLRKAVFAAFTLFILYLAIAIPLSSAMKIPYLLMAVGGSIMFFMFLTAVGRGVLQGRQMFRALGNTMMFEGALKLLFGLMFVYLGWKVYGAIIGAILSVVVAFFYIVYVLRPIIKSKEKYVSTPKIYRYSLPVFIITFTVLVFYNLDILIAKIAFDAETAGLYAITAVIAKTIFFATQPISRAMFPLTARERQRKTQSGAFRSALIVLVACIVLALFAFYFFPDIIIWIFTGKSLPAVSSILFYAALATSLLSLTNLVILYRLSQGQIANAWVFILFVIAEALLLFTFSSDLLQFVLAFLTASALFLWGSVMLLKHRLPHQ